jgi:hypothetical protein
VLAENLGYFDLTRQRAASYWACYYRWNYPAWTDYPGQQLLAKFKTTVAAR